MTVFAIIPAAPILLPDVDSAETARIGALRTAIETVLAQRLAWALPVHELPVLAGLGGWGIDRGIDTRTGKMLHGQQWVQAVSALDPTQRAACESAHPAIAVALLHAHDCGVRIGPLGSSDDLLMPIDLSVAATDEAPLAPVPGAADADEGLVSAVTAGNGPALVSALAAARDVHADLELLKAGAAHMLEQGRSVWSFAAAFDENVHDVRSLCGTGTY